MHMHIHTYMHTYIYAYVHTYIKIKTSGSESRDQDESACMRFIRPKRPPQRVIYTDDNYKFLKCCGLAAITAIV